ncbi:MAG TPA: glycoside hydrolase family 78 protein [Abditibacteriaceae bacterium]
MNFQLTNPRCEYQTNPLGIGVAQPRLSWEMQSETRGARQTAYQILAASSTDKLNDEAADVWNSERIESDASAHIAYEGPALQSRQRVYWTARAWDENGTASEWLAPQWFEMGLLDRSEWSGEWIGSAPVGGTHTPAPAPFVRNAFRVEKPVVSARLYATALGVYECEINGQRVGDIELAPGWTDYAKRVQYQTYDVTDLLQNGDNAVGAILGDGWYCGRVAFKNRQVYGDRPKFLAQLEISFEDGSRQTIETNGSWTYAFGPILENDLLAGEAYDARREIAGWSTVEFDRTVQWLQVETFPAPAIEISAPLGPPVRAIEELTPISEPRVEKNWQRNIAIFDLGQNMTGRVRLKVSGEAGTTIKLRYAEVLDSGPNATEGELYTENLRTARCTDFYTLKGGEEEVWEPRFTFHGFRYVELSDFPGTPTRDAVTGIVMHSDTPRTGDFECSDELLNQLQKNIDWGQRGNFLDIPTDCPQRDERLGWTGDAQVFVRTSAWNRDVAGFFTEWARDTRDAQQPDGSIPCVVPDIDGTPRDGGPAWSDAAVICPWKIYLCYGDKRILEENYDVFQRFFDQQEATAREDVRPFDTWQGFGDWLAMDNGFSSDGRSGTAGRTRNDLIGTAFFAHEAALMSRIATVLDKPEDAARYARRFEEIRKSFCDNYITSKGILVSETQTASLLALHFNLAPQELHAKIAQDLKESIVKGGNKLTAGFVGSSYLNPVLTATGHLEQAYALLHQTQWPSWLYAVTQGATTIWERWDGWTHDKGFQNPEMNSFNHYAYGAIGEWLYNTVAGIDIDEAQPGYKHIIFRPQPGGQLTSAKAHLYSIHGLISSSWNKEGAAFDWSIEVPANTTATVYVPCDKNATVTDGGASLDKAEGVRFVRRDNDANVYEVGSGTYTFRVS